MGKNKTSRLTAKKERKRNLTISHAKEFTREEREKMYQPMMLQFTKVRKAK